MHLMPSLFAFTPLVFLSWSCALQDHGLKSQTFESTSHGETIAVDEAIYATAFLSIQEASGSRYIAKAIPYGPINKVKKLLETRLETTLQARPEAHLTLVTPPEYQELTKVLKRENILALADRMGIQKSSFSVPCLGKGTKVEGSSIMATYYLVVQDEALTAFRQALAEQFLAQGGKPGQFLPLQYHPHITVAFTKRDLHFEDGVVKDQKSCIFAVEGHSRP